MKPKLAALALCLLPHLHGADCASMLQARTATGTLAVKSANIIAAVPAGSPINAGRMPLKLPVPLPTYCLVSGTIDPRQGANNTAYGIGFSLALPENWNERFLLQGGGGLNGSVAMPLGSQAAGAEPALARGFAVASMDSGHQGQGPFDAAFFQDQKAALDFYYLALGRMTVVAKELIAQHYGRPAAHSYFSGCSTGGREGMILTQRYPEYFDGVIVGNPAMRTDYSNLALSFIGATFSEAVTPDATGKADPAKLLNDSERKLIVDALLDSCDALDGLKDGMISHPTACKFDPATLTCPPGKSGQCLTATQVQALKTAFAGPRDAYGNPIYVSFPYDTGIGDNSGFLPGLLHGPRIPVPQPATTGKFDAARLAAMLDRRANTRLGDSLWTHLSTFAARGKVIFYHGVSDPWFSANDTFEYYRQLAAVNGGEAKVQDWSRFYFVPGMGHCSGGSATLDSFDILSPLTAWVEQGTPPQGITATGRSLPGRSRPLCPYPTHAHYNGQGDPQDARNFTCQN